MRRQIHGDQPECPHAPSDRVRSPTFPTHWRAGMAVLRQIRHRGDNHWNRDHYARTIQTVATVSARRTLSPEVSPRTAQLNRLLAGARKGWAETGGKRGTRCARTSANEPSNG